MSEIPSSVPEKPSEIKNKYEQELFLLLREKLKSRTHLFPKLKDSKSIEGFLVNLEGGEQYLQDFKLIVSSLEELKVNLKTIKSFLEGPWLEGKIIKEFKLETNSINFFIQKLKLKLTFLYFKKFGFKSDSEEVTKYLNEIKLKPDSIDKYFKENKLNFKKGEKKSDLFNLYFEELPHISEVDINFLLVQQNSNYELVKLLFQHNLKKLRKVIDENKIKELEKNIEGIDKKMSDKKNELESIKKELSNLKKLKSEKFKKINIFKERMEYENFKYKIELKKCEIEYKNNEIDYINYEIQYKKDEIVLCTYKEDSEDYKEMQNNLENTKINLKNTEKKLKEYTEKLEGIKKVFFKKMYNELSKADNFKNIKEQILKNLEIFGRKVEDMQKVLKREIDSHSGDMILEDMQEVLNIKIDNNFGYITLKALIYYQIKKGVSVGRFGRETGEVMFLQKYKKIISVIENYNPNSDNSDNSNNSNKKSDIEKYVLNELNKLKSNTKHCKTLMKLSQFKNGGLLKLIMKENRYLNPNESTTSTSAYGLGQMTNETWKRYGNGLERDNVVHQLIATVEFLIELKKYSGSVIIAYALYNTGKNFHNVSKNLIKKYLKNNGGIKEKYDKIKVNNNENDVISMRKRYLISAIMYYGGINELKAGEELLKGSEEFKEKYKIC